MAPKMEFKVSTYERLTSLSISRLNTIKDEVVRLSSSETPLTQVQLRFLKSFMTEVKRKCADYELNLQRVLQVSTVEELSDDTLAKHQDTINSLQAEILAMIEVITPPPVPPPSPTFSEGSHSSQITQSQVRLPQLDLVHFSGDLSNWTSFINLFDTTIHRNASLTAVIKFQYLLSILHSEPLNLIKGLALTSANYAVAYNLLRERYHNPRRLTSIHLNQLLDLPSISSSSIKGLRQFVNVFTEHSQALKALECDVTSGSNPLLSALMLRKMDNDLRKRLEMYRSSNATTDTAHSLPEVKDIISFLNTECVHVEDSSIHSTHSVKPHTPARTVPQKRAAFSRDVSMVTATQMTASRPTHPPSEFYAPCFFCHQKGHKIYSCNAFKDKTPQERFTLVKKLGRCFSCLGNHDSKGCRSKATCQQCQKRHHTLLHFPSSHSENSRANQVGIAPPSQAANQHRPNADYVKPDPPGNSSSAIVTMSSQAPPSLNSDSTVLLGTALIKLRTPDGNSHVLRALLDSGSMCDLISERAAQLLNATRYKSDIRLCGLSQHLTVNRGQVFVNIETLTGVVLAHHQPLVVLENLTLDLPRVPISPEVLRHTQRYILADPTFHIPGAIDVVIGGALFPHLLTHHQFSLGQHMPQAVGTHFGYVLMGSAPCAPNSSLSHSNLNVTLHSSSDLDLHSSLQRFWQQEEPPPLKQKTIEEEKCDRHFETTHSRRDDGRYVVQLPFKDEHPALGSSVQTAERRFYSLEKKFTLNPQLKALYSQSIKEHMDQGHMVKVDQPVTHSPHYFLPHHGILKESSTSTKLRIVYDASSKTSSGRSLNDVLLTGRKLQTNICDNILLHFRTHRFVFTCDIRQMYLQIFLEPSHQNFQLLLWRDNPTDPLSTYKLTRVTFGVNSSPYQAIKTLHQLAEDEGKAFPTAAEVLRTQTYVDDIITGADTEEDALNLQVQLTSLLKKGGFELRKWVSNSPALLQHLPEAHIESPVFLQEAEHPHFSILGIHWSPSTDCFTYSLNLPVDERPTKRSVLSVIAKIYDPCGFLSPCIMLAKCFMQFLWTTGLTWDEPLQPEHAEKWKTFVTDAQLLSQVSIPRSFELSLSHDIEYHGFCDASENGTAAIVYIRCQLSPQEVIVRPVVAKTRVAPLKRVTIPRLELCAAHLLAQLISHCQSVFGDKIDKTKTFLWSDSTVVLTWLRTPPYRLKTYVANRVSQTQELIRPEAWRHVSTSDNPADCASRGIPASQLIDHPLWWTGPLWLQLPHNQWPTSNFSLVDLESSEELKPTPLPVLVTTQQEEWSLLTRYSSWDKLQRTTAWILRFVDNCRSKDRRSGFLSIEELKSARNKIFSAVQQSAFAEDISKLQRNHECSTRLQRLKPFIRQDGLLCVGGRLNLTRLSQDVRNPVLLPKSHKVVDLFIDHFHISHLHAGPQLTQALLAQHVWILSSRSVIRSRIFKCIRCFRNKPRNKTPLMGELPLPRVTPARSFLASGIDYAGPYPCKVLNLKSIRHTKVYLCVFVCMVTKAVHLEVVHDLTAESFIAALTRFVSRRGLCTDIYSDCGTCFKGGNSALSKIVASLHSSKEDIHRFSISRGIKFHFNPPAAPHQGGLWESAVKSAKYHLRRVMGDTVLTLPELITLTTQVEAMLNSRPLTALSSDPADLTALTPGHFLIGSPLAAVPEPDRLLTPQNRLKQWQLVQCLHQRIWRRWHLEYLHTLHQRVKWTKSNENLKIGDLVLVHTPSAPLSWPLARITAVRPGADGIVRVVELKTATGNLTRPAAKVFPFPTN